MRFLQEAARLGAVHVLLLSDDAAEIASGRPPEFSQAERRYFVEAIRYVSRLTVVEGLVEGTIEPDALPAEHAVGPAVWAVRESEDRPGRREFCDAAGLEYVVIGDSELEGFPEPPSEGAEESSTSSPGRKKVVVTGCYDWLHSGHLRFFEEAAELGDLYVIVGHDRNVTFLKGKGHPMYSEEERLYMAASVRHVKQALLTSGYGWLDAAHEIERIEPDMYVVNEDGDRPEKRQYCEAHGIEYRVLTRLPKQGLPLRQSAEFRGF